MHVFSRFLFLHTGALNALVPASVAPHPTLRSEKLYSDRSPDDQEVEVDADAEFGAFSDSPSEDSYDGPNEDHLESESDDSDVPSRSESLSLLEQGSSPEDSPDFRVLAKYATKMKNERAKRARQKELRSLSAKLAHGRTEGLTQEYPLEVDTTRGMSLKQRKEKRKSAKKARKAKHPGSFSELEATTSSSNRKSKGKSKNSRQISSKNARKVRMSALAKIRAAALRKRMMSSAKMNRAMLQTQQRQQSQVQTEAALRAKSLSTAEQKQKSTAASKASKTSSKSGSRSESKSESKSKSSTSSGFPAPGIGGQMPGLDPQLAHYNPAFAKAFERQQLLDSEAMLKESEEAMINKLKAAGISTTNGAYLGGKDFARSSAAGRMANRMLQSGAVSSGNDILKYLPGAYDEVPDMLQEEKEIAEKMVRGGCLEDFL